MNIKYHPLISVIMANDLNMPLGKIIAQASHAVGLTYLSRMKVVSEDHDHVDFKINKEVLAVIENDASIIEINYCKNNELNLYLCKSSVEIIDSGRTVFNEPTKTCISNADSLGGIIQASDRIQYDCSCIPVKQAIFINRNTLKNTEETEAIALIAKASAEFITDTIKSNKSRLDKKSNLYLWLTSAFGKTVIGTKNSNKFELLIQKLRDDNIKFKSVMINGELLGVCTAPINSSIIHVYTKYKTFNLLN